jgi:hypothetical protein
MGVERHACLSRYFTQAWPIEFESVEVVTVGELGALGFGKIGRDEEAGKGAYHIAVLRVRVVEGKRTLSTQGKLHAVGESGGEPFRIPDEVFAYSLQFRAYILDGSGIHLRFRARCRSYVMTNYIFEQFVPFSSHRSYASLR